MNRSTTLARNPPPARAQKLKPRTESGPGELVVVGKDVLELLSSAMYVEPLSIYREYIQNAADAIEEARGTSLLHPDQPGQVDLQLDSARRSVRIRDNGSGISVREAPERLLSIGASVKRGSRARGFRGVGRLAGLAYCRQLVFRTRSAGDDEVLELAWDCQKLKAALRDISQSDDLASVVNRIVTLKRLPGGEYPVHFFEVELGEVVRRPKDALLNTEMITTYLSQVAPVPFHPEFSFGATLREHLGSVCRTADLCIRVNNAEPISRPHRDTFPVSDVAFDRCAGPELLAFQGMDGEVAALGWVMHHGYFGALPDRTLVKGLRMRVGDVQIGDATLLEHVFPESRFNSWTVGEIHVLDPRILPNARRDHFEQNVHYEMLTGQLEPLGRSIARRCRAASIERNRLRRLAADAHALSADLPSVAASTPPEFLSRLTRCVLEMQRIVRLIPETPAISPLLSELKGLAAALREHGPTDTGSFC